MLTRASLQSLLAEHDSDLVDEDARAGVRGRLDTILRTACLTGARKASRVRFDPAILDLFTQLPSDASDEDLEDMIRFFADAYQFNGVPVAMDEIDFDAVALEVRTALEETWGKRAAATTASAKTAKQKKEENHLFLVLDKDTCGVPWESMPILRRRSVSRIPSLAFLQDRLAMLKAGKQAQDGSMLLDVKKTFYVLNPGGDLKRSEERFLPWLQRRENALGWKGISSREPFGSEFSDALSSNDLLMYFGHSGAEQFVRPQALKRLQSCAVTMLWGCSSGVLLEHGEFDRTGTPFNYMMAGCNALVANLWDLTDRELDNVSESVFLRVGLMEGSEADPAAAAASSAGSGKRVTPISKEPVSLPLAVAHARDDCKLPFLTGAACIVYGIPVRWESKGRV